MKNKCYIVMELIALVVLWLNMIIAIGFMTFNNLQLMNSLFAFVMVGWIFIGALEAKGSRNNI